ncbi:hypothetical protein ACHAWT_002141 [Skeletonema menzelii]
MKRIDWSIFPILCVFDETCPLVFIARTRTHERIFDPCSLGCKFNPKDEIPFRILRERVFTRNEPVHPMISRCRNRFHAVTWFTWDQNEAWRGDERRIVEKNAFNQAINQMMDWLPKDFESNQS